METIYTADVDLSILEQRRRAQTTTAQVAVHSNDAHRSTLDVSCCARIWRRLTTRAVSVATRRASRDDAVDAELWRLDDSAAGLDEWCSASYCHTLAETRLVDAN